MGCYRYRQCMVVFCSSLLVLGFALISSAVCAAGDGKELGRVTGSSLEKDRYSFDFPSLSQESIRQNYVNVNYNIHKDSQFHFKMFMNKNWNGVKVAEPSKLPMDGSLAEIGVFNLYSPLHDNNGAVKAQIIVYITSVPTETSAADYLDKYIPQVVEKSNFQNLKIVRSDTRDSKLGPVKDALITYSNDKTQFLSRMYAFKVEDDRREYVFGKRDLLYLIQLSTQEEDYESYGAEAFYMAKVTLQLE